MRFSDLSQIFVGIFSSWPEDTQQVKAPGVEMVSIPVPDRVFLHYSSFPGCGWCLVRPWDRKCIALGRKYPDPVLQVATVNGVSQLVVDSKDRAAGTKSRYVGKLFASSTGFPAAGHALEKCEERRT